ncbi:Uncharacterised protein [Mycobacteroides abscessus subsp. abscessus]|nr:Uncharacterised protein [Mycobacteroides abscessus subsp. abscessus]
MPNQKPLTARTLAPTSPSEPTIRGRKFAKLVSNPAYTMAKASSRHAAAVGTRRDVGPGRLSPTGRTKDTLWM